MIQQSEELYPDELWRQVVNEIIPDVRRLCERRDKVSLSLFISLWDESEKDWTKEEQAWAAKGLEWVASTHDRLSHRYGKLAEAVRGVLSLIDGPEPSRRKETAAAINRDHDKFGLAFILSLWMGGLAKLGEYESTLAYVLNDLDGEELMAPPEIFNRQNRLTQLVWILEEMSLIHSRLGGLAGSAASIGMDKS